MARPRPGFVANESGAVAPLFAIGLVVLVAMGGLAWDVSRGFALRGELDAAVDAAALAGATQLDGGGTAITRATTAVSGLVTNAQRLADDPETNVAAADKVTIQFLSSLSPRTYTTSPAAAQFIEVDATPRSLGLVLGVFSQVANFNAVAHAVAGYGSAICMVPPLALCNPDEPKTNKDTNYPFDPDTKIGRAIVMTEAGNTNPDPGFFGFLQVNGSNAASVIGPAMGQNPPDSECYGSSVDTAFGNKSNADKYFNTRFDIFGQGGTNGLKNDPRYAPSGNTMIGDTGSAGNCGPNNTSPPSNAYPTLPGSGSVAMPIDQGLVSGMGSGVWAAASYFQRNHGFSSVAYTPAVPVGASTTGWAYYGPSGGAGVTSPTRYQTYRWELAQINGEIPKVGFSQNQLATSGNRDYAKPQCNKQTPPVGMDRRTFSAVVLNCQASPPKPNTSSKVVAYIDLFLIAPAANSKIFGEVLGTTTAGSEAGKVTRKYSVRLYE